MSNPLTQEQKSLRTAGEFIRGVNGHIPDVLRVLETAAPPPADKDGTPPTDPVIILEAERQVAVDLWLFKWDDKGEKWRFAGIYRDGVLNRLNQQGFFKRYRPDGNSLFFLHAEYSVIHEVITARMLDAVTNHVEADREPLVFEELQATYPARSEMLKRQSHLVFNERFLQNLSTHDRPILQDTAAACYLPFRNGIVEVTSAGASLRPYSLLSDSCVWKSQVIQRDYRPVGDFGDSDPSHFARFIANVTNGEEDRLAAFRTAIGYLVHGYNSPADGQAVICYDEELTDRRTPQGGTGKGVFANAIRQIRPVAAIDGKKFDPNDRFCFQQVNQYTRVVWIDDPKPDFNLERFFSTLTEGWTIEKKNERAYTIPQREGPKLLISTNTVLNNEGTSNIRRQFILEFANFYQQLIKPGQKTSPIVELHGGAFFTQDWDAEEWARFDRFMIGCVAEYMRDGQQQYITRNVASNRLKQTAGEDFFEWVTTYQEQGLQPNQEYKFNELFADFKTRFTNEEVKSRGFTNNLKRYASTRGWAYKRGSSNSNPTFVLQG